MSDRRIDPHIAPLDPELNALLDVEREAVPPAGALERLWSRIERSGAVEGSRGPNAGRPRSGVKGVAGRPAVAAVMGFGAGVAVGFGLHALWGHRLSAPVISQQAPSAAAVDVDDRPSGSATASTPEATAALPSPPHAPSAATSSARPAPSSLSAERALLDNARTALTQGEPARAIALTEEHARRFPRPRLAEEREAIAIQALVLAGRPADARERAALFRATFPNSLFLPAVETSLESIP
jgi:hypothetical protein